MYRDTVSYDKPPEWMPLIFCVSFWFVFLFKSIMNCILFVIYVSEDNDTSV